MIAVRQPDIWWQA